MSSSDDLTAALARFVRESGVPGASAAVVRGGERGEAAAWGFADLEAARPAETHTRYRIASITKTFTATAILQLRDDGRLALDDPLVRHVPEFAAVRDPHGVRDGVTLRRLLTHTAGLQRDPPPRDLDDYDYPAHEDVLARLADATVVIAPETAYKYSNLGFELLGEVVSRVAGVPFTEHIRTRILAPLGMRATTFEHDRDAPAGAAVGYAARRHADPPPRARSFRYTGADGGLWSTAPDLARWLSFGCGGDDRGVLSLASRREMQRPHIVADPAWLTAQGLGWYSIRSGDAIAVGHTGGVHGFHSAVGFIPDQGVGAVVLTNGDASPAPFVGDLIGSARQREPAPEPSPPPAPPPAAVAALLGRYADDEYGNDASLDWRDGRLVYVEEGGNAVPLEPTPDPDVYTITAGDGVGEPLYVRRRADGTVYAINAAGDPMRRLEPVERG
jgi:D-alanyl-D-alanine carboxypeptidase